VRGKAPIDWLTEMYPRSDRFAQCLRLLLDRGAEPGDPSVIPVLLDDADALETAVRADRSLLAHRVSMVSAFTPLEGASLLHVAAEYGNLAAARRLIDMGADVNARAAHDAHGLGGQTPLFHTVNSNANRSEPLLRLLLKAGARTDSRLEGLIWGKGFEWETTLFDVTPLSYAQAGLLPQMHRDERDIYANLRLLLEAAGREVPPLPNVPNRYLRPSSGS
jgi:ankyrin repeat protein